MPTKKLDTIAMEIHMGVLAQKMIRLKQQMNVCIGKLNFEGTEEELKAKGIDKESETLKWESLNQQYSALDTRLSAYEDQVLTLTEL
jgi:hypothetical protein